MVLVAFLALLHLPGARGPVKLPALALGWVALAGATLLLQAQLPAPALSEEQRRLFPDARFQVEQEGVQATHATLLAVFAAQAGLMALALKLRLMAAVRGQDAHLATNGASQDLGLGPRPLPHHSADLFCGVVPLHMFQRTTQLLGLQASSCDVLVKRLSVEGVAWGPTATNLAAATSFALGLSLNGQLTGGAPGAVFMLAPVLLLLHQDPLLLPGLTEARRYAPPMAAIMGWLAATSGLGLLLTTSGQAAALRTELGASHPFLPTHQPLLPGSSPWTLACFEGALLLVTVPAMWQVMQSLWALKAVKGGMLLVWAALCLLPLAASSMPSTQCLALTSMVGAAVQLVASRHRQQRSARVV
ncbi:hypothetical protein QJQ45_008427 [Haematococcus lacustris]|nr:hypothetical protein QJQ45_008427 [Haematococcus lacustris]